MGAKKRRKNPRPAAPKFHKGFKAIAAKLAENGDTIKVYLTTSKVHPFADMLRDKLRAVMPEHVARAVDNVPVELLSEILNDGKGKITFEVPIEIH